MAIFDKPKGILNLAKQKVSDTIDSKTIDRIKDYGKTASEAGSKALSAVKKGSMIAVEARKI